MKTLQFWSLTIVLLILSGCSLLLVFVMRFVAAMAGGFFMDAFSAWINKQSRRVMQFTFDAFEWATEIVNPTIKVDKPVDINSTESLFLGKGYDVWVARKKNKRFLVTFKSTNREVIFSYNLVEHCEACAIDAAIKENNKTKDFDPFQAAMVSAEYLGECHD